MDWLLSQCLCVCDARTGDSSLTIPQASLVFRSCHGNRETTDEALLYESLRAFCKYTLRVSPVAMMQAYLMTCWTLFEFIRTMPFNSSIPEVHELL